MLCCCHILHLGSASRPLSEKLHSGSTAFSSCVLSINVTVFFYSFFILSHLWVHLSWCLSFCSNSFVSISAGVMGNVHFFSKFIVTVIMVWIIIHNSLLLHCPPSVPFQRTLPFYILFSSDVGILSFPKAAFNDKRGRREDTIRPEAAGMLFPLDWNVSPLARSQSSIQRWPPRWQKPARWRFVWAARYIGVTCASAGGVQTGKRQRAASSMAFTFNYSD